VKIAAKQTQPYVEVQKTISSRMCGVRRRASVRLSGAADFREVSVYEAAVRLPDGLGIGPPIGHLSDTKRQDMICDRISNSIRNR
jgi:hypothetical protein